VYAFAFSARNAAGVGDSLYIDVDLNDQIEVNGSANVLNLFLIFAFILSNQFFAHLVFN
jgi:hypothetical protein